MPQRIYGQPDFSSTPTAPAEPARQYGQPTFAQSTPAAPQGPVSGWDLFKNVLGPTLNNFNPLTIIPGAIGAVLHPINTVKAIGGQMGDQWSKAGEEFQNARNMPNGSLAQIAAALATGGHALAGSIPLVGPAAAKSGETIAHSFQAPDYNSFYNEFTQGIGEGIGAITAVTGVSPAARAIAETTRAVKLPGAVANLAIGPTATVRKMFPDINIGQTAVDEGVASMKGAKKVSTQVVEPQLQAVVGQIPGSVDAVDHAIRIGDRVKEASRAEGRGPWMNESLNRNAELMDRHYDRWQPTNYQISPEGLLNEKRGFGEMDAWSRDRLGDTTSNNIDSIYKQQGALEARDALDKLAQNAGMDSTSQLLKREQGLMAVQTAFNKTPHSGLPASNWSMAHQVLFNPHVVTGAAIATDRIAKALLGNSFGNRAMAGLSFTGQLPGIFGGE